MLVAAWCRWTPKPKLVKFGEQVSIGPTPNTLRLHCNKKCARYLALKIFAFRKVNQSSPQSLKTCYAPVPPLSLILLYLAKRCMRNVVQEFFYASCHNPPNLSCLGTGTEYTGLHTQWLGFFGPLNVLKFDIGAEESWKSSAFCLLWSCETKALIKQFLHCDLWNTRVLNTAYCSLWMRCENQQ